MRRRRGRGRPRHGVGNACEGFRFVEAGPVADGPADDHGTADHGVLGDRAAVRGVLVDAGVRGVVPVVAHHPQTSLGHGDVEGRGGGGVARVQVVRFGQRNAVDGDPALRVTALDVVAADPDDPFDQVLLVVGGQQADEGEALLELLDDDRVVLLGGLLVGQPAARVVEDDDVPALRLGAEPRGELVDQDAVADPDRLLHGARRDHERLDEEGLQDQRYEDGDTDQKGDLPNSRPPALALHLALELAPLRARAAAAGRGGAPRTGGQQVVRGRAGHSARFSAVTHVHRPERARARTRAAASGASSGRTARRSSRPGR